MRNKAFKTILNTIVNDTLDQQVQGILNESGPSWVVIIWLKKFKLKAVETRTTRTAAEKPQRVWDILCQRKRTVAASPKDRSKSIVQVEYQSIGDRLDQQTEELILELFLHTTRVLLQPPFNCSGEGFQQARLGNALEMQRLEHCAVIHPILLPQNQFSLAQLRMIDGLVQACTPTAAAAVNTTSTTTCY